MYLLGIHKLGLLLWKVFKKSIEGKFKGTPERLQVDFYVLVVSQKGKVNKRQEKSNREKMQLIGSTK